MPQWRAELSYTYQSPQTVQNQDQPEIFSGEDVSIHVQWPQHMVQLVEGADDAGVHACVGVRVVALSVTMNLCCLIPQSPFNF